MALSVTPNAISQYFRNDMPAGTVLQVLEIKRIQTKPEATERFRLVLTDGTHYQQAMLTTQLNYLITDQSSSSITDNCLIRVQEAIASEVSKRHIIVILRCEVVGRLNSAIGSPMNIEDVMRPAGLSQNQPPPPQPHQQQQPGNPYAQPAAAPAYMQQQRPLGGAVAAVNSGPMTYHPIASLNPYQQRWTIKARVTNKGDVRTWSNAKGEGKLMSVDLLDAQGGEIRATMFNDAVDKFKDLFQQDRVYVISKGQLKIANKKFTRIANDYELTLNPDTEVQLIGEDPTIQAQRFDFVPIEALRGKEENDICDVIGVVTNVSPITSIVAKATGREMKKRSVTIADMSNLTIELTLWGDQAEKHNEQFLDQNPVIAVKACKVSNFGGKQLSATFGSQITVNPDRPETQQLIGWWQSQGCNTQMGTLTERSSMAGGGGAGGSINDNREPLVVIRDRRLGFGDKPDFLTVRATVTSVLGQEMDKTPWYLACPTCNKKVNPEAFCEKCNTTVQPNPRYILNLTISDHSFFTYVTAFSEQGQMILKMPAVDLMRLHSTGDEDAYKNVFAGARFSQWIFKLKIKAEQSQQDQEQKARCSIVACQPVDYVSESRRLLDEVNKYPAAAAAGGGGYQHQTYQSNNYY